MNNNERTMFLQRWIIVYEDTGGAVLNDNGVPTLYKTAVDAALRTKHGQSIKEVVFRAAIKL